MRSQSLVRAIIVCNGYKDREYTEMALLATKLGKHVVLVVEKFSELLLIARLADQLSVVPHIGFRCRL